MSRRPAKKKASPKKPPTPRRRDDCKLGADELPGVGHPEFDRELSRARQREEVARAREAQQFLPLVSREEDDMTQRPEGCTWWTQPHQTAEPAGRDRGRSLSTQIRHAAHRLGLDWEATRDELLVEWCVRQWGDLSCAQLAVTASVTIRLDEIADRAAEVTDEPTAQLLVQTALVRLGGLGKLRATDKHLGWLRDRVSLGTPEQRGANIGRMLAHWGVVLDPDDGAHDSNTPAGLGWS